MDNKRGRFNPEYYVENILKGDKIILSRAITIVESQHPQDEALSGDILNGILKHTGNSIRMGLTGAPGVGKSTFIESFGKEIIAEGNKVAILTIDPSSSKTKGSILGDKTRMTELSKEEDVYIRPTPAGQSLGGVAAKTREVMLLCEAAGFNIILIETVGVGQSETLVKGMVDFFLLLMLAGGGDELQGIKRGIMELADMILITKADGENIDKAKKTRQSFKNALNVLKSNTGQIPEIMTCSALTNYNLKESWIKIKKTVKDSIDSGSFVKNRKQQSIDWMHEMIKNKLRDSFYLNSTIKKQIPLIEKEVLQSKIDASFAAQTLLNEYWQKINIK